MTRPVTSGAPAARIAIGVGGLVLVGVGLFNLLGIDFVNLLWVGFWLAAGLFLHDFVLSPAIAVSSKLVARRWSVTGRRVPLVALVSIASLTLIALPLLGKPGAEAGNPTLLGRNYLVGWAAACLLVLLGAALAEVAGRVRARRGSRLSTTPR